MIAYSERVKTLILDPIDLPNGESWVFKIDIFKHLHKGFFATLWRLDMYNIHPTFAIEDNWTASESFFIDDSFQYEGLGLLGDAIYFKTLDECQSYVLKCINDRFNFS